MATTPKPSDVDGTYKRRAARVHPESKPDHKGEHRIRTFKQYHEEVFDPTVEELYRKLEERDDRIAALKQRADASLAHDHSQTRAVRRLYEQAERDKRDITDLQARLRRIETRATSTPDADVSTAEAEVAQLSADAEPILSETDLTLEKLSSRLTTEVRRLDNRINEEAERTDKEERRNNDQDVQLGMLNDGQASLNDRTIVVENAVGVGFMSWPLWVGVFVGFVVFVISFFATVFNLGVSLWYGFGWGAVTAGLLYAIAWVIRSRKMKSHVSAGDSHTQTVETRTYPPEAPRRRRTPMQVLGLQDEYPENQPTREPATTTRTEEVRTTSPYHS